MKISMNWLADFVDLRGIDAQRLGGILTMSTAEIEEVIPHGRGLHDIRTARVVGLEPHPGADRLTLARVDVGGEEHGVVCGAPNVAKGVVVPIALPGTRLPDGTAIRAAKIRGVRSEGMLCSARELGLGDDHAGLLLLDPDTETGCPLPEALPVEDTLYEIDNKSLTHRPDLWGHYGFAREIAGVLRRDLRPLDLAGLPDVPGEIPVRIEDENLCPRYVALALSGLTVGPSPLWLRARLQAVGVRPISNLVDFTNYVMLEIGQPMHAFDRTRVAGPEIVVRVGRKGERLTTLDGKERDTGPDTLLIADRDRAVAVAGVMGGADSEIDDATTSMILESANFDPVSVRRTAARLGLRTDAATRFEKSLDPELAMLGVRRFARLVERHVPGATVEGGATDAYPRPAEPRVIRIAIDKIRRRLGAPLEGRRIVEIFRSLEFGVEEGVGVLDVAVPSFRATKDIEIEEDLIEEIGRIHGYDNIEGSPLEIVCEPPPRDPRRELERRLRHFVADGLGFDEIARYSFVSDDAVRDFDRPGLAYRRLRNPIAKDASRMRRSLVPSMLEVLPANLRHEREVRLFEIGRVYHPAEDGRPAREERELAAIVARRAAGKKARREKSEAMLRAAQGALETILGRLRVEGVAFASGATTGAPWEHPARSAVVRAGDAAIGLITQIHPGVLDKRKLEAEAALFVLDVEALLAAPRSPVRYQPIPRFPATFQDLAVVVDESVPVGEVRATIERAAGPLLVETRLFDVYRGQSIPQGRKSLAFELVYQSAERTLRDDEVAQIHEAITRALEGTGGAVRGRE